MAEVYYITNHGTLKREENTLLFENGELRKTIPVEQVEEIFIMSEISLNTKLLSFLSQHEVPIHFFNYYGYYVGSFYPREKNPSGFLLVKQVEHYLDPQERLFLAKSFVMGAIQNACKLYSIEPSPYVEELRLAKKVQEVMEVEGSFKKLCYQRLEALTGWEFERRTKRPPSNPLNALISFGNSLVYAKVLGEIYHTPLNSTVSYLHEPSEKRHSLCLDIAEVFKPILSEKLIIELINSGTIDERDFLKETEFCYLTQEGKRKFSKAFDKLLNSTVSHPKLRRKVSHRTLIRLELYKLIKHLTADQPYTPLNYWAL
ncbi:type I-B CRISPR-associated endonuclease Cas1b [Thermocrinis sp.]